MDIEQFAKEKLFYSPESIFNCISKEAKDFLIDHTTCKSYKKGEMVFEEGAKPNGLISLSDGKVKIFKEGAGGREQIVRLSRPCGFIGYRSLFAGENYHASAMAMEPSVACTIEKSALFYVMKNDPTLTYRTWRVEHSHGKPYSEAYTRTIGRSSYFAYRYIRILR